MKFGADIELDREALQNTCDAEKSPSERNRLGQFGTPSTLALDIVRLAEGYLSETEKVSFLDPAFGTGSFFSALLRVFKTERIERSVGFEIDRHYADRSAELWDGSKLELHVADFTRWSPPPTENRFNLVICNPPYVRHHHLPANEKARLHGLARSVSGTNLSGLTGLYAYFLLLSHAWSSDHGLSVWLVPSEFMDVNYGVSLKEYLLTKVTLLRIHRFAPEDAQFGDALVSSAVVCFRKTPPPENHLVKFSVGGSLGNPKRLVAVKHSSLHADSKWNGPAGHAASKTAVKRLADFFDIKRGLATGDNKFFILSPEQVREHHLPGKFLKPILPSPRYLNKLEVDSDSDGNPTIERKLFLLDCKLPEHEIRRSFPALAKYLNSGAEDVANGYLCRSRSPWYSQENRPAPPLLCTYMGRGRKGDRAPFRFILNNSKATAANVYLLLYPKTELSPLLIAKPELIREIWRWLNELSSEVVSGEGRVYGGGLYKLEPRELGNLPADDLVSLFGSSFKHPPQQLPFFPVAAEPSSNY